MTELPAREIRITPEFQRKLKVLSKKYRQICNDIAPILDQLGRGETLGDRIPGIGFTVMKVRVRNSDTQKGKSGGYRLIYWAELNEVVVLLDIYPKSEQSNFEVTEIRQIINRFTQNL
jgi:mRNA-degrading endonuclease RelE of RelBE toxin-antitoxin system